MKIKLTIIIGALSAIMLLAAFKQQAPKLAYVEMYGQLYSKFENSVQKLQQYALEKDCQPDSIRLLIYDARLQLKRLDFWWRYFDPIQYKLIHGPLPVEWETEVFEKYEKPYKRLGGGLTLAELALNDGDTAAIKKYLALIPEGLSHFRTDSVEHILNRPDHFAYCNRLFILNLSTIYTTGFECPDETRILPELDHMMHQVEKITKVYNATYTDMAYSESYLSLLKTTRDFVKLSVDSAYSKFDHFGFVSNYTNPLYGLNTDFISKNKPRSSSFMDYSINKEVKSIFDKSLYYGQNTKGIFLRISDPLVLKGIEDFGASLFFDPILSGNNQRSCASCHRPDQYFTDTSQATALQFNHSGKLLRNTPSLMNAEYNHLVMQDGQFYSLQDQALAVITNPLEMGCKKEDILKKTMSVKAYAEQLRQLSKLTPQASQPSIDHILSALTYYYSKHSKVRSRFDLAMELQEDISDDVKQGFNLFMSKGQCA